MHTGDFRLSPNQNLVIANVTPEKKMKSKLSLISMVLQMVRTILDYVETLWHVAFPTCGLAMAESERYLPSLISKIEDLLDEAGVQEEEITIRMTGCPNGCARPALAEVAFIGKAPGKYNMYLGGGFKGERLNKLYKEISVK